VHYVYILQSLADPNQYYTGLCADVRKRLAAHNSGQSSHTSKFRPWRLLSAHYFVDQVVAASFERYLKTGSGRAFAAKRLRAFDEPDAPPPESNSPSDPSL
jgi:predicted GIY-YIG superfamily endonuclease